MATTKIWKIESRLGKVLDYAKDKKKTLNKVCDELELVYNYATNKEKTEEQLFVTGINCTPEIAVEEMRLTKKHYGKTDKILGFHAYQSFVQGETTPEIAHEIGVKLAQELWGDRFEVIVTTHLNTNCLHNHLVLNSVSFVDGKKFYDNRESYALMRATSDELCREYGLNVLEEKTCMKSKINYNNFLKKKYQNSNYYITTKEDIDRAIGQAYSYNDFENIMKAYGYTLTYRANKLSVCRVGYKRNIRIERAYGDSYSIDKITERIREENLTRVPFQEVYARKKYHSNYKLSKVKKLDKKYRSSLYRLYTYYRYKLNSYRNKNSRKPLSEEQRKAIKQMNKLSEEAKFLSRNKIHSTEELFSYKQLLNEEIRNLELEIRKINRQIKQNENKQMLINLKLELYSKKTFLKEEVEICEEIEKRIPKIKEELREEENEKEREENERSRGISR